MFDKFELTTLRQLLLRDIGAEWNRREQKGYSKETIQAQLHGLMELLVKLNLELLTQNEQDQSSSAR